MATKIMPVTDLRRKAARAIRTVREEGEVIYITQHGRPAVVLVDYEQYEALLARLEELVQLVNRQAAINEPLRPYAATSTGVQTDTKPAPVSKIGSESASTSAARSFVTLAALAEDLGLTDLATQHDHYLYGLEKS